MANIKEYLKKILEARYGKDVRGSIHDAIRAMNADIEDNVPTVRNLTEAALQAKAAAESYAGNAKTSKISAKDAADQATSAKTAAEESASSAKKSAEQARSEAASAASTAADAVRTEVENFSTQAAASAASAKQSETNAAESAATAGNKAEEAAASATGAKQSETNAAESAATAGNKAEEAAASATGAKASEDNAKNYMDKAKTAAEEAKAVSNVEIATTAKVGIVKPDGETITIDEDGTIRGQSKLKTDGKTLGIDENGILSVNLDGTTITLDEAKKVIKLADTLKDAINGAFPAAKVANNQITTEAGFALDARQANPNIDGSLAKQLSDLNGSLKGETATSINLEDLNTGGKGVLNFTVRNGIRYVSAWGVAHPDGTGASITVYDKMPKAAMCSGAFGELAVISNSVDAFFFIDYGTTRLGVHLNTTFPVYASFSYPILI